MADTITFRPTAEDKRIIAEAGGTPTEALRRALRLLDRERWWQDARADMDRLRDENLNDYPAEDWSDAIASAPARLAQRGLR